jgi:hypothetical protein
MHKNATHNRVRWAARAVGAGIGVLGLAFAAAIPSGTTGSAVHSSNVSAAATRSAAVQTSTQAASTDSLTAARYGWGRVVSGDEFNYRGAPDRRKWRVYSSAGHNGNGRRSASAWRVDGSVATVTGSSRGVTGGMSSRTGKKYGRWEIRMKTNNRDLEYHPNLMLWPDRKARNCPEVDFAESTTQASRVKFFLHYGCAPRQTWGSKSLDMTKWHNYAVEWTPSHIYGYVDGVRFFSDTNRSHQPKGSMHASVQLDWFRNGSGLKTSTMSIAWVRIYNV